MASEIDNTSTPVLVVTDAARGFVAEARSGEANPDQLALYLEVNGVADGAYSYDMWFQAISDATPGDAICHHDDLSIIVLAGSVERVSGATLDLGGGGLMMVNPNTPPAPLGSQPVPKSDLSSPLEIAVLEVLENEVNPQLASHGGRAELVAVDDAVAYLRLSGGCQGCGLAAATLSQGISVAIKEAVPEIVDIVDVTAHADGTNPYFEAAKK